MSNVLLPHPTNGTLHYGRILAVTSRGVFIPGGPVVLKVGKHRDPGGFGAEHIWGKHAVELVKIGYAVPEDVPKYVAEIVRPGSPVHCEFDTLRDTRVTVVRTTHGVAVLRYEDIAGGRYSVITAFAQRNAHGTRIGTVGDLGNL
jgi:hypothetical protein